MPVARKKISKPVNTATAQPPAAAVFPIVALGASAGGLKALTAFLQGLRADSGLALVVIQHLDPLHSSALAQLLSRVAPMKITEATEGMVIQPNHGYVIPPNKSMIFEHGALRLSPRDSSAKPHHPIDEFLVALAKERQAAAIGVILSGSGSDGTIGLSAIKAAGGVTFAQDPKSAEWPSMPQSAIAAGAVDFVLAAHVIALEVSRLARHPYPWHREESEPESKTEGLDKIYKILLSNPGVDLRLYKPQTVHRRVLRRMAVRKIDSLPQYASFLKTNPEEAECLADDIFIHVTEFFRDSECFQALRIQVLSRLRAKRAADDPIRVWIAGCSTGEEVYSVAMALLEELGPRTAETKIQIFGTDIAESVVQRGRSGMYSEAAVKGITAARLKRFFVKSERGYEITKAVRDLCVFARHDLAKDPPFSRLDLISCRNVLIYMGPLLQKRVLQIFQYALKPGGSLFLGKSESISAHSDLFTPQDYAHKIFSRKSLVRETPALSLPGATYEQNLPHLAREALQVRPIELQREAEQVLLNRHTPPALVIDADFRILHYQGDAGPYLEVSTGPPTVHLLKLVRPEFVSVIRRTMANLQKAGAGPAKEIVLFSLNGQPTSVELDISPLGGPGGPTGHFLLVFKDVPTAEPPAAPAAGGVSSSKQDKHALLERELTSTRDSLRALVAEHEVAQEEMKAASEETLSTNEELQSTNEELETAKEELQSSNEELITLNEELRQRNSELNLFSDDLSNLLTGVQIPVLVLDESLSIRRFTPVAGKLLNLIATDVGRPFSDIASTLDFADWETCFAHVVGQGETLEREVKDRSGFWYLVRMRPYRSGNNRIEGVIIVLLDIDLVKRPLLEEARESRDYAGLLLESSGQAIVAVGADEKIVLINTNLEKMFGYSREEMVGRALGMLLPESARSRHAEHLRGFFAAPRNRPMGRGLHLEGRRKDGTLFRIEVSLSMIEFGRQKLGVAFLANTEIGALAAQLITAQEQERRRISRELHDGLCQHLASLALDVERLASGVRPGATQKSLRSLQTRAIRASEEARHLSYELHPSVLDDLGLVVSLSALCAEFTKSKGIPVQFTPPKDLPELPPSTASGLYRIAQESLQNIARHAPSTRLIVLELAPQDTSIELSIQDDGLGFERDAVRRKGGLGLVSMEERARMMGGVMMLESAPLHGTRVVVRIPLRPGGQVP